MRHGIRLLLGLVCAASLAARPAEAQLYRQHAVRYQANDAGEIVLRGNTLTTCAASAACATAQAHTGAVTTATASLDNNAYSMVHVDVDGDPSTFNSSRSSLALPVGGSVLWAGLYWSGRTGNAQRSTVRFRTPASGGYLSLTAQQLDANGNDYQAFRDVTTLVQAGGSGSYTAANVFTTINATNQYAGWALIVVVRNPARPLRNLTVFDGFANISGSSSVNVTVSGFLTPALGTPNTIIGLVTYEGDRGIVGDQMLVNGVVQSNTINAATNFHTGTIADTTSYLSAGQQPAYTNQLGLDVKTFRTTNVPAGATSALLRFTSTGDQYYPGVVTFQTDLFNPIINGNVVKAVYDRAGGALTAVGPGDTLRYDLAVANTGQDGSVNTVLVDTIPAGVSYVPGSIQIVSGSNPGAKTDLTGDDQAEFLASPARVRVRLGTGASAAAGGNLAPGAATRVRFLVRVDDATPAGFTINNQAFVSATSQTLGQAVNAASRDSAATAVTGAGGGTPPTPIPVVGPNLTLGKTVAGDIPRGGSGSFTLTVRNIGTRATSLLAPIVVVDTLPTGITPVGATGAGWACAIAGAVVTCTRSDAIAAAASAPAITITVTAAASAPASFTNVARVSGGGDNTPGDNAGSVLAVTVAVPDFALAKTAVAPTPFVIGGTAQYRLRVRNVGSAPNGTAIELRDTLAAGLTFVSGGGDGFTCTASGQAVTCARPGSSPLAVNDSAVVLLSVAVAASAAPGVGNAARVVNGDDPNATNDRATTPTVPVISDPDLELTKAAVGVFTVGQNATYRLRVRHVALTATAPSITVTDSLGAGLTFVAATGGGFACAPVGALVTCTRGTALAAGDSAIVTFTVAVGAGALPAAFNKAWVTTPGDANATNDTTVVSGTPIAGTPDLSVTKSAAGALPIGQPGTFTITVTNVGTAASGDSIVVADTLPATLTFVSAAGTGFSCAFAAPVARCVRTLPLPAGQSVSLTLTVQATLAALPTITNRVSVATPGDANPANDLFTLPNVPVVSIPDLAVTKSFTGPMTIGQPATWRVLVRNVSPGPTSGTITVQDSLAAGLAFGSASGTGFTCGLAAPIVTCTRTAALASGDSVVLTLVATPTGPTAAAAANLARASTSGDVNAFNDTSVTAVRPLLRPDLAIAKTHTGPFSALDTLGTVVNAWTITLTNVGGAATTGAVTVVDSLPAQVQFIDTPSGGWSCAAAGTLAAGRVVTCSNPGPVAPSGTLSLVLRVTARPAAAGAAVNIARVSTPDDITSGNDRATDPTTITAVPDLKLYKSNNRTTATPALPFQVGAAGQQFTLSVVNAGGGATTGPTTLTDTLPRGFLFTSGTGTGFTCTVPDSVPGPSPRRRIVQCVRAAAMAPGDSVPVTLAVTVLAEALPSVSNTADVATTGDPNPANDRATDATAPVVNPLDLTIIKTPVGAFTVGSAATYELVVSNLGTGTSTLATTITDTLAPGLTFASGTGGGFTCVNAGTVVGPPARTIVSCTRAAGVPSGTLGVQGTSNYTVTLTVNVTAAAQPSQINRVWVANTDDTNLSNNSFETGAVAIVSAIDLTLTKSPVGAIIAGGTAQFNLSVANIGASATTGTITVTDTLPVGLTLAGSSGGGFNACTTTDSVPGPSPRRRIVQCVRPSAPALAGGDQALLTLTVDVGVAAFPSVQNRAQVATANDFNTRNDTSSTAVLAVTSVPDFSLVKTGASPLSVGLPSNFTLTIANVSPVAPGGNTAPIVVTDTLPAGFAFNAAATAANPLTAASLFACTATAVAGPRDVVTCTRPAAPAMTQGAEVQVVLVTDVTAAAVGTITNTAWLATIGDLALGNNSSTTAVLAVVVPDLTVSKVAEPGAFVRGQPAQYVITVTNAGTGPTTGPITLVDQLAPGLAFVGVLEPAWSCAAAGTVAAGLTVTCTRAATLAPSATAVATLGIVPQVTAASVVDNTVSVATPTELNTGNNGFTLTGTPVSSAPDLALSISAPGPWTRNVPAQVRLVPTNVGTSAAAGPTTLTTTLPAGVTFSGTTSPGWTCSVIGPVVSCVNPAPVAVGDSLPLVLDVLPTAAADAALTIPATVTSPGDANAANDAAAAAVSVGSAPDVALGKAIDGALVAGQGATFRLVVRNVGSAPTSGAITVVDTLAPVLAYVLGSGGGFGCNAVGAVVTCTRPTPLAAGDSAVVLLNVNVASIATGTVANAAIASTAGDPNSSNDAAVSSTPVGSAPDLALSGVVQGPALGGQPVIVRFTPTNQGSAPTSGVTTFVTTMPAGATFNGSTSPGWSCTAAGQQVTCTTTTAIAPGGSLPLEFDVQLPASPPNPVSFPSTISTAGDANPANNAANPSASVGLVPDAALSVVPVGPINAGQPGTIRFTVTNVGGAATTDSLRLTATLPPGVTFTGSSTPGWTCSVSGSLVTCRRLTPPEPALASGASTTVDLGVLVAPTVVGQLPFAGTIRTPNDPNATNDNASASVPVASVPDLAVTPTLPGPVVAGQPTTLRVVPRNVGSAPTTGSTAIGITVPPGVTWNGINPPGYACTLSGATLSCVTATTLAAGDSLPFTLTFDVPATASGTIAFPVTGSTAGDPNPANDSGTASAPITQAPDLALSSGFVGPVTAGQPASLRLVPRNVGSAPSSGTTSVAVTLPTGLTWNGINPAGYTCSVSGNTVTCTTTTAIAPGDSLPLTLGIAVAGTATGTVSVPATVTAVGDPNPANDDATASATVGNAADLDVSVAPAGPFVAGQPGTLRLATRNVGGAATNGLTTLVTTLPTGLTFTAATTPAGWSCSAAGQVVTCTTSNPLTVGDSAVLTLGVDVGAAARPSATVTATVNTPGDANAANDAASTVIPVGAAPDVTITSTTPGPVLVGRPATTTITGTNRGSAPTTGPTTITTTLPPGTTFTGATGPGWTCTVAGQVVTCTNPAPIAPGDTTGVVVTFVPGPAAVPGVIITSTASTPGDPNPGNDGATSSTPVAVAPDLSLAKAAVGAFMVGQPATYTLTLSNLGSGATTGDITVTDSLPATLAFVSASGPDFACAATGGVVTCTRSTPLPASAQAVVTVVVRPSEAAIPQVVNVARASTPGDPDATNDRSTATTTVTGVRNLAITKSGADTLRVGGTASWVLGVRNAGALTIAAPVTVIDSLPAGVAFTAASGAGWSCAAVGQVVTCTQASALAPGATADIVVSGTVGIAAFPSVVNRVRTTLVDADSTDNRAERPAVVTGVVDLELRKVAPNPSLTAGLPASFLLTVWNRGTIPTQGAVTITDSLPTGMAFASGIGTDWTCAATGSVVTCTRPTPLAVGDSSLVTLGVTVGSLASGTLTNVAVAATPLETNLANNRGTAQVTVTGDFRLAVDKTSQSPAVTVGGTNDYAITVRNVGASPVPDVRVTDQLPRGFLLVGGSVRLDGTAAPDPVGAPAPTLTFALGTLAPGAERRITYRTRITAQVQEGRSVNTATASSGTAGVTVAANSAAAPVQVRRSVFSDRGVVVGKVFTQCDCGPSRRQTQGELGVPGVRVVLEDGTSAITDAEGKYNFWDVPSGLHVVRVDQTTLPAGARLVALSNRNARDGASRFVDLKGGELFAADFALASDADVYDAVQLRRRRGEPTAAIPSQPAPQLVPQAGAVLPPASEGAASAADTSAAAPAAPMAPAASAPDSVGPVALLPALTDATSNLPVTPLRARQRQAGLAPTAAGRLEITTGKPAHPADGVSLIPVRVRLLDAAGQLVRGKSVALLETSVGTWTGAGALDAAQSGPQVVLEDGEGVFQLASPGTPGVGEIRVTTTVAEGTVPVRFVPAPRPFFLTGLLQGRLDQRLFERGDWQSGTGDRFERLLRSAAIGDDTARTRAAFRGAMYAKGTVFGDQLLTLGWDSERNPDRTQFRDIDPDQMFPTYGDASLREFDAQTQRRFYARLDDGRSYTRLGDFQTQRTGEARLLGAWDRSLTGLHHHAEGERGAANVYAARTGIRQFVEELPGRGLSGPYLLSRLPVINSERIELVTRDRNQPSLILRQRPMQRFADYLLESGTNRVVFRAPVPSLDEQFNPVSVRVTYEVEQAGEQFTTAGADAQVALGRLSVGGVLAVDRNPLDSLQLLGVNAALQLGAGTVALAEFAQTRSMGAQTGDAARLEVRHAGGGTEWRIFGMRTGTGFANRSAALGIGRQELGGRFAAALGLGTRITGEALQTEDLVTGGRRRGAQLALERSFAGGWRAEGGLRWVDETTQPASPTSIGLATPPSFTAVRGRLTAQLFTRTSVFGEVERALGSDVTRWSVGGEHALPGRARLYARHETIDGFGGPFALTSGQRQQNTVVGLDADWLRNSQVFSEYRARDAFSGRDVEASMGLRNRWAVAQGLLVNTSFERVSPLVQGASPRGAQTAVAGAAEWTRREATKLNGRLEWRLGNGTTSWLGSAGVAQKLSRDWTFLARSLYDETPLQATERWRTHAGFAWRETDRNRWNALFRYEHLRDRQGAGPVVPTGTDSERHLLHTLANLQATDRLVLTGRLAAQWQTQMADNLTSTVQSQLVYGRAIYDLTANWDAGLVSSVVLSEGARQRQLNFGFELGRLVASNARVALGWNTHGYSDRVSNAFGYTTRGFYLDFGVKFDETLFTRRNTPGAAPRAATGGTR